MLRDFVETHISFNTVHLVLEVYFTSILIGDNTTHISYNSGKKKYTCKEAIKWNSVNTATVGTSRPLLGQENLQHCWATKI